MNKKATKVLKKISKLELPKVLYEMGTPLQEQLQNWAVRLDLCLIIIRY